jgi:hypothetical protein
MYIYEIEQENMRWKEQGEKLTENIYPYINVRRCHSNVGGCLPDK